MRWMSHPSIITILRTSKYSIYDNNGSANNVLALQWHLRIITETMLITIDFCYGISVKVAFFTVRIQGNVFRKYRNVYYGLICIYNTVGVAVAMVISTMHEKSCIDSHNARKFE